MFIFLCFILKGRDGSGVPVCLRCLPTANCSSKSSERSTVAVQERDEPGRECRRAGQHGISVITCTGIHPSSPPSSSSFYSGWTLSLSLSLVGPRDSSPLRQSHLWYLPVECCFLWSSPNICSRLRCSLLSTFLQQSPSSSRLHLSDLVSFWSLQDEVLCHTCRLSYVGCHRHSAASRPFTSRCPRLVLHPLPRSLVACSSHHSVLKVLGAGSTGPGLEISAFYFSPPSSLVPSLFFLLDSYMLLPFPKGSTSQFSKSWFSS